MRKASLLLVLAVAVGSIIFLGNGNGAPSGKAGDPASGNVNCTQCHAGPAPQTGPALISSDIPVSGYTPGQTYTITAEVVRPGHNKFGFQVSPQTSTGAFRGTLINTSTQTQLVGSNHYITHTSSGTSGTNFKMWSFNWTAPATGQGPVTFYGAFNVTNNNNASSGDTIYLATLTVNENISTGIADADENFWCSIYPNPIDINTRLDISLKEAAELNIALYDLSGKLIISQQVNLNNGFNSLPMPYLSELPTGTYFINISSKAINKTLKISKI
jgi:hypothetical protein